MRAREPVRRPANSGGTVARVSFSGEEALGAVGDCERRDIPVFGPRGVAYRPCQGDRLLLLPVDGANTCVGVLCETDALPAGELLLTSAGGARIHLKNSGDVEINGVIITRSGQIIADRERGNG